MIKFNKTMSPELIREFIDTVKSFVDSDTTLFEQDCQSLRTACTRRPLHRVVRCS